MAVRCDTEDMSDRYFEDFQSGQRFTSRGATLSEAQILDFALQYDPQPIHLDKVAAADGPFGGLIASGFQTLVVAFRLFYQENIINKASLGSPGFDNLRWLQPVRPGDTIHVEGEVKETKSSRSKADRGYLKMAYSVRNQDSDTVMTFLAVHILARRPETGD